eukprot:scaffold663793_cov42-Prasinocladus_malaysianus.AAC.1
MNISKPFHLRTTSHLRKRADTCKLCFPEAVRGLLSTFTKSPFSLVTTRDVLGGTFTQSVQLAVMGSLAIITSREPVVP